MKKLIILFSSIIMVTGCGGEKLKCEMKTESSGFEVSQKIDFTFKDEKMTSFTLQVITKGVSDEVKNSWNEVWPLLKDETDVEKPGVSVTQNNDNANYKYTIKYVVNVEKAKNETIQGLTVSDLATGDVDLESLKTYLETQEYSCK